MIQKKMRSRLFPILWGITTFFLVIMLWQQASYARIINYSGLVRGATQRYIKGELCDEPNDKIATYIDRILYDLQTGEGEYNLTYNSNKTYQQLLADIKTKWLKLKKEAVLYEAGQSSVEKLYKLSEEHFALADEMVLCAENNANNSIWIFIICYIISIIFTVLFYILFKRKNNKILHDTIVLDELTGILSRVGFKENVVKWLRNHHLSEYVMMKFDIRDFKKINAIYSHAVGDQLLEDIGHAISEWQPSTCLCAHTDADNFYVFAKKSPEFFEEFRKALVAATEKLEFTHHYGAIIFSFGIYELTSNREPINIIMDKTSTAHKLAKKLATSADGINVIYYNQELVDSLERETYYSEHLYQGIANKEFQMYLQPQLNLETMEVVSAEALVRWKLPTGELVFPDLFIPLFEGKGMMNKLDFYMLEQACSYLKEQLEEGKPLIRIGVNFSRLTLYEPTFFVDFVSIVDDYHIPHCYIEIEVVETALNEVDPTVIEKLTQLGEIGFEVAMDDFGAGYSSLNCLSNLPVQTIKLDRQFLVEVDRNPKMKIITTSLVEMAHNMGMHILCEGVEYKRHVEFLHSIGCDLAQGYYFSRPVPKEQFNMPASEINEMQ